MVPGFSEVLYVTFKIFILVIRTEDQKITVMSVIFVLMPVTFEITFLINGVVLGCSEVLFYLSRFPFW